MRYSTETVTAAEARRFVGQAVETVILSVYRNDEAYGRPERVDLFDGSTGLVVYTTEAAPTLTRAERRARAFARRQGFRVALPEGERARIARLVADALVSADPADLARIVEGDDSALIETLSAVLPEPGRLAEVIAEARAARDARIEGEL